MVAQAAKARLSQDPRSENARRDCVTKPRRLVGRRRITSGDGWSG